MSSSSHSSNPTSSKAVIRYILQDMRVCELQASPSNPNKLDQTLICEICSSVVIRRGADSTWTETQFELPLPRQNKNVDHTQKVGNIHYLKIHVEKLWESA